MLAQELAPVLAQVMVRATHPQGRPLRYFPLLESAPGAFRLHRIRIGRASSRLNLLRLGQEEPVEVEAQAMAPVASALALVEAQATAPVALALALVALALALVQAQELALEVEADSLPLLRRFPGPCAADHRSQTGSDRNPCYQTPPHIAGIFFGLSTVRRSTPLRRCSLRFPQLPRQSQCQGKELSLLSKAEQKFYCTSASSVGRGTSAGAPFLVSTPLQTISFVSWRSARKICGCVPRAALPVLCQRLGRD